MKAVSEQVHIPLVLTEAKAAESASDFDGLRDALFPVWPDTSIDPDRRGVLRGKLRGYGLKKQIEGVYVALI